MIPAKDYIASLFIDNTYHFVCDCLIPIDVIGTVRDFEIHNTEIVLLVSRNTDSKIIHIGLNTPSLKIEVI